MRPLAARLTAPLVQFLRIEAAGGLVLLAAAAAALVWANSPWHHSYEALWQSHLPFAIGGPFAAEPLRFWINEGLMTAFFFVVGLELRREMREGALAGMRRAALPVVAAVGGMIVPAIIYLMLNSGPALRRGWAVPTATDIAFALGVLGLLGKRIPAALRVLLLALAISDDIGTVLIIAFAYSRAIAFTGLLATAYAGAALLLLQRLGLRVGLAMLLAGVAMWIGLLRAGIHPTIAGIILGFLVSAPEPAARLENALHPWVAYGVVPLFALANAGVRFESVNLKDPAPRMLVVGIACALVIGKLMGIALAIVGAVRARLCALPMGLSGGWIVLLGLLGGIGFTMAIFVAGLAFADPRLLAAAKLGILTGSTAAALFALLVGWLLTHTGARRRTPLTARRDT
jgi:NhaA family Na+:H+ antiporter